MREKLVVGLVFYLSCSAPAAFAGEAIDPASERETVSIKSFAFAPAALHIHPGTIVVWKNLDGEPHTVVSDAGAFRSGALDEGDSFQFKFDKPGTYRFFCSVHPHMTGTIVVD